VVPCRDNSLLDLKWAPAEPELEAGHYGLDMPKKRPPLTARRAVGFRDRAGRSRSFFRDDMDTWGSLQHHHAQEYRRSAVGTLVGGCSSG
jgi:hypothetical protein